MSWLAFIGILALCALAAWAACVAADMLVEHRDFSYVPFGILLLIFGGALSSLPTVIAGKPAWTVGISAAIVYGIVLPKVALGAWASGRRLAATRRGERTSGQAKMGARKPVAGDGRRPASFKGGSKSLRLAFFVLLAAQTCWVIVFLALISGHIPQKASLSLELSQIALLTAWWLLGRYTRRQARSM
jgi:hypothetical protein